MTTCSHSKAFTKVQRYGIAGRALVLQAVQLYSVPGIPYDASRLPGMISECGARKE